MAKNDFAHEELNNGEDKCLCVLLLDTSGSMSGEPIRELNKGLQQFQEQTLEDETAASRLEVAIITFGGIVQQIQAPALLTDFEMPTLTANSTTPMLEAIEEGITLTSDRKDWYKSKGIKYYRPWIILMTDGEPDDISPVAAMGERIKKLHEKKALAFSAIGVGSDVNMSVLETLAQGGMSAKKLQGTNFVNFFRWLSNSIGAITENEPGGGPTKFESTDSWEAFSF
ncbi:vWA domain-containing protein [Porphyromonas gingivicanis]|uniref:vWA domain-containing protein n=1 Tax=Porphyromonas gingivicanis TaxID=266762 RepID=UPI00046E7B1D|nr:VWA domain-containing protein [Porphyromonas gingivicanis]MDO4707956.1 VWA domain-containing protein [Porphyromonadaceae bacterium]